jgi:hypothetical protein
LSEPEQHPLSSYSRCQFFRRFDESRQCRDGFGASETQFATKRLDTVQNDAGQLLWPRWATWALIAVILTSVVTIGATIKDIW